jgi:hypothetical protein
MQWVANANLRDNSPISSFYAIGSYRAFSKDIMYPLRLTGHAYDQKTINGQQSLTPKKRTVLGTIVFIGKSSIVVQLSR